MAKGGKNKIKTYKPPPEKFVAVTKAWGVDPNDSKVTCNQVGAWFELMLSERYPGTRPCGIYYHRKKMHHFIIELPSKVDIHQYLGSHRYDAFLKGIETSPHDVACLYEYNYKNFGHPEKTWNQGFADYARIPEGFPVRSPYPPPEPTFPPPGDLPSAIYPPRLPFIPVIPQIPIGAPEEPGPSLGPSTASSSILQSCSVAIVPLATQAEEARPSSLSPEDAPGPSHRKPAREESFSSETSRYQPYEPPSHYRRPQSPTQTLDTASREPSPTGTPTPSFSMVTPEPRSKLQRWDPYEEEEAAEALLRSAPMDAGVAEHDEHKAFVKDEHEDVSDSPVKDEALDFLQSVIPIVKLENEEQACVQAPMSLSRSATVNTGMGEEEEGYVPSAALAAAFASMEDEATTPAAPVKLEPRERPITRVKEESCEGDLGSFSSSSSNLMPSSLASSRSQTFNSEPSLPPSPTASCLSSSRSATATSQGHSSSGRPTLVVIKPEPMDDLLPPLPTNLKRPSGSMGNPIVSGALQFKKIKRES